MSNDHCLSDVTGRDRSNEFDVSPAKDSHHVLFVADLNLTSPFFFSLATNCLTVTLNP